MDAIVGLKWILTQCPNAVSAINENHIDLICGLYHLFLLFPPTGREKPKIRVLPVIARRRKEDAFFEIPDYQQAFLVNTLLDMFLLLLSAGTATIVYSLACGTRLNRWSNKS